MKQYNPSPLLRDKMNEFISGVKKLDDDIQVSYEQTDRDVVITVISMKYGQVSRYAVWDVFKNNILTGNVDGSILSVQRIY